MKEDNEFCDIFWDVYKECYPTRCPHLVGLYCDLDYVRCTNFDVDGVCKI